jgi:hypothetical protein
MTVAQTQAGTLLLHGKVGIVRFNELLLMVSMGHSRQNYNPSYSSFIGGLLRDGTNSFTYPVFQFIRQPQIIPFIGIFSLARMLRVQVVEMRIEAIGQAHPSKWYHPRLPLQAGYSGKESNSSNYSQPARTYQEFNPEKVKYQQEAS